MQLFLCHYFFPGFFLVLVDLEVLFSCLLIDLPFGLTFDLVFVLADVFASGFPFDLLFVLGLPDALLVYLLTFLTGDLGT